MIECSFDARNTRNAAVSGAYQYDTGQRLRLCGLPGPDELAERDDFLSGDVVTVQAQFGYAGDSQTESSLAEWDRTNFCWVASVPDAYLQRHAKVMVYVYVSYGSDDKHARCKTCYEAVFTPTSRPAPSNKVTPEQSNEWDRMVAEINLALSETRTATSNANAAATSANEAAAGVESQTGELVRQASSAIDGANTAAADAGSAATEARDAVTNANAQVAEFNLTVQELQRTMLRRSSYIAVLPSSGWAGSAAPYTQTVTVNGIRATDSPFIDVYMEGVQSAISAVQLLEAYGAIGRISAAENSLTAYCYEERPQADVWLKVEVIR